MTDRIDTLVIGSGFGGAVVAHRLVTAGERVTLLERGPWRDTAALAGLSLPGKKAPLPQDRHLPTHLLRQLSIGALGRTLTVQRDGFFDLHLDGGMTSIASSGVGGGSHVYLAMNLRPQRADYWDHVADGLDAASMEPHYAWMLARMGARPARPEDGAPNLIADRFAGDPLIDTTVPQPALGFRYGGAYGNNAFLGDAAGRKVTLDALLLAPLLGRGLTVLDRHEALAVHREGGAYRVEVRDGNDRHRFLRARRVVLAAGTLNTLRLLRRSLRRGGLGALPGLGQGFSGNGDAFALWRAGEPGEDFRAGPPCLGRFTLRGDTDSPMLYALGLNGLDALPGLPEALRRRVADWLVLVGMGEDAANGTVGWRGDSPAITYEEAANPILGRIHAALGALGRGSRRPLLRVRPTVTVHPLGGARVGDDPRRSVVNSRGQVHGHPGLFISDGSALPAAPGTPPSMTVAAWAGHVSQCLLNPGA